MEITIDPEFKALLSPLTKDELATLEANLVADGSAIEPICVWAEEGLLLDGHNRYDICHLRDLDYKVKRINLPDRAAALKWIIDHQMGKRNLSEAGKVKARSLRRARVARAASEGKSTRAIAKEEKVSTTTVQKDLAKAGVNGVTPAKVKGSDGKQYPSRVERLGLYHTPPPPKVVDREPGDDTDSEKADKEARKTEPKPGKPKFDWKPFEATFAKMMLFPDLFGKAYGVNNTPQAKALRTELVNWKKAFKTWTKTVSKKNPPMEIHEKLT